MTAPPQQPQAHATLPSRSSDSITTLPEDKASADDNSPSPSVRPEDARRPGSSFLFPSGERAKSWQESYLFDLLDHSGARMAGSNEKAQNVELNDFDEADKVQEQQTKNADHAAIPKTLGWKGAFFNQVAFAIALGVLSIPLVAVTLGVVPFVLLNFLFAFFCWYVGEQYFQLKLRFPGVQNLQDAGRLMFGPIGGHILGFAQLIFCIFLQGNHVLLGAQAFNVLGSNLCAVILALLFAIISFVFTLPRSYKLFSYCAFASFASIVTVVIYAMIASGISGPSHVPANADPMVIEAFGPPPGIKATFMVGLLYVLNLFISYGAIPSYLPIMSEMRNPTDYRKSLITLVLVQLVLYLIVGGVIYYNLGQYTTSPSLDSLSVTSSKIAFGLALPTILIAGCEAGQVSAKHVFLMVFRSRPHHIHESTRLGWIIWVGINAFTWLIAFVLAEVIPFFSAFLGLEAALFWSLFNGFGGVVWLYLNQGKWTATWRKTVQMFVAITIISISAFICVAGVWASALAIRDAYSQGTVGRPFSCASSNP